MKIWWGRSGLGMDMFEAAKKRSMEVFEHYDSVAISFSGGKDSMATLEVTYAAAEELGKLPLVVNFYDDEVIAKETEEYVLRTAARPGIDLRWYQIPTKHRNACTSLGSQFWYPWDPTMKDKWVRIPPPEANAITLENIGDWYKDPEDPMRRPTFTQFLDNVISNDQALKGQIAVMIGIRAGESQNRAALVANDRAEPYIFKLNDKADKVYPVYDWSTEDLWTAASLHDWDHNYVYDHFEMAGIAPSRQRIGTPFGDEPMESLWEWAELFPDVWNKTCERVPGVAAAARYARTDLYAYGSLPEKPADQTWQSFIKETLDNCGDEDTRIHTSKLIRSMVKRHYEVTDDPILKVAHPITAISWDLILKVAVRGDSKGRKTAHKIFGDPNKYELALAQYRADEKQKRLESVR